MSRRVVCFSGLYGSQMHEVARGVAERLGVTLVDEEIVLRAAVDAGVEPQVMADVEVRRSFMERVMHALRPSADAARFTFGGPAEPLAPDEPVDDALRDLIRAAIEETAARGSVVIVSHAASHALASRPDVLRVLITASDSTRRAQVASERDLSEKDADRELGESDAARADYLKRFYGVTDERPTHYDLVVNTDRLSNDEAVSLVVLATGR